MTRHSLLLSSANAFAFFHPLRFCSKVQKSFPPPKIPSWVWRSAMPSMGAGLNWQCRIFNGVKCHTQYGHSNGVVVASDESYGNKQVVTVTPQLYDYILAHVREPQILRELREETSRMPGSQMQVSPDQAQLLVMLVQMLGAQRCIEIGVYTGYSSLAVALVLPESGRLIACERDAKCLAVAKRYYQRAGVSHKVDVRHALAVDSLQDLLHNGETNSYDFAFLDAEKRMYHLYYELLFQLIRPGGLIVIDNVLWHGKVADPLINDKKTASLRAFNTAVFNDKRVSISMIPIGDGVTLCWKR